VNALKTYAHVTTAPGYRQYLGYMSVDAFVEGLKLAGPNPTQASLISAMLGIRDYNGAGLYGSTPSALPWISEGRFPARTTVIGFCDSLGPRSMLSPEWLRSAVKP
jgi:hypothetical protein